MGLSRPHHQPFIIVTKKTTTCGVRGPPQSPVPWRVAPGPPQLSLLAAGLVAPTRGRPLAICASADTIRPLPGWGQMAPVEPTVASLHRLADQLQLLSELTESLTYRLLEVEERLELHEQQWQDQSQAVADSAQAEEMELRLMETEDRLARMESLLKGLDQGGGERRATPLRSRDWSNPTGLEPVLVSAKVQEGDPEEDPFPEDGEQLFMDEQVA